MNQTINLNRMGLQEMSYKETTQNEGGFIPLVIAAVVLLSGCTININSNNGNCNSNNSGSGSGNSANNNGQGNGNRSDSTSTGKK